MDIDFDAPVVASAQLLIDAPLERVWRLQADVESWPSWNPGVAAVALAGPLAPGVVFRWKAGGMSITSRMEQLQSPSRVAWSGSTLGIRARHIWRFTRTEEGTLASTEESFDGVIPRLFAKPMRRLLKRSLDEGLAALRDEAERRSAANR